MRTLRRVVVLLVLAGMVGQAPAIAQTRSAVSSTTLDAAVSTQAPTTRSLLTEALTSDVGLAGAAQLGLDADDLTARIAALDDASVQQLSERVLAGGHSTIVISTTTIIIVLLLLILLTD